MTIIKSESAQPEISSSQVENARTGCVDGEPMMHGPRPYRWCATHNDLMLRCESLRSSQVVKALKEAVKRAHNDFDVLIIRGDLADEPRAYETRKILTAAIALADEQEKLMSSKEDQDARWEMQ